MSPTSGGVALPQDPSGGLTTSGSTPRSRGCEKNLTKTFEAVTAAAAASTTGATASSVTRSRWVTVSSSTSSTSAARRGSAARACQRSCEPDPVNFGLDRDLLDCYTVMFYNGREGRGLVPLDRVREYFGWFWPVLAVTGGATVGSVLKDFCFVR